MRDVTTGHERWSGAGRKLTACSQVPGLRYPRVKASSQFFSLSVVPTQVGAGKPLVLSDNKSPESKSLSTQIEKAEESDSSDWKVNLSLPPYPRLHLRGPQGPSPALQCLGSSRASVALPIKWGQTHRRPPSGRHHRSI